MLTLTEIRILHQLKNRFKINKLEVNYQKKQDIYQVSMRNKTILNDIHFNLIFEHRVNDNQIILNDLSSTYQHNLDELGNFSIKQMRTIFINLAFKADAKFNDNNELITKMQTSLFNENGQEYFDKYVACLITLNNYYLVKRDVNEE